MDEPLFRLGVLARALVPFLFMMASVYLAVHIVFARLISSSQSQVLAFFTIVTTPLTWPIRALLPPGRRRRVCERWRSSSTSSCGSSRIVWRECSDRRWPARTTVLALAATNLVGVVLFAALYATAGARLMSQTAFAGCLLVIFALVTVLWVRVEGRHRTLEPLRRVGRGAAGLVVVLLGVPALVLMPVFWLESKLPPEAGFTRYLAPLMTLVLISLGLVVLVNVVGGLAAAVRRAFAGRSAIK